MSRVQRFSRSALTATPWKNGGGSTREIACWPPGAGLAGFEWRISIATIAQGGPFSVFEGIDRQIMLLDGDGVHLRASKGAIDHRLDTPHRPFAFSGDVALDCALLGGISNDFNVMTRRGRCRAQLQLLDAAAPIEASRHGLLFALRGRWSLAEGEVIAADEGVWWADAPKAWHPVPDAPQALLLAVRIVDEARKE
ncbi:HutD family protein [Variovorax sp. LARHSF232]